MDFSVLTEFYLEDVVESKFVDEGDGHVETVWVKSHALKRLDITLTLFTTTHEKLPRQLTLIVRVVPDTDRGVLS